MTAVRRCERDPGARRVRRTARAARRGGHDHPGRVRRQRVTSSDLLADHHLRAAPDEIAGVMRAASSSGPSP
jgi:hypothetical protein